MDSLSVERSTLDVGCSAPLALLVISPETEDPREHPVLTELFTAGLTSYHLRKPTWTRAQLAEWLHALPSVFHPRIVLHTHHDLATEFTLGGLHHRDPSRSTCHVLRDNAPPPSSIQDEAKNPVCHVIRDKHSVETAPLCSRAIHDLPTLRASLDTYDRLLVSPLFPSFSKTGYAPDSRLPHAELKSALALPRRAEVIALGGIDASRLPACRELGFDGAAVLGAIWQSPVPVNAFHALQDALRLSPIASRLPSHAA